MKKPIFKCWREDWEIECQKKKDPVNKAKFERKYKGLKFYDFDHENRILECTRIVYNQAEGYSVECSILDKETLDDKDIMTTTVVHECIVEKQCDHLNPHVRMIQKSYVEDLHVSTKPAKASARKVDSIDVASDSSDSDLSTKRMKRRNTNGERNRMYEQYNRKKEG